MKSPITGELMELTEERRSIEYKMEIVEFIFHFYKCSGSGEQFTTTQLDKLNMKNLNDSYRNLSNTNW
jgi:hypothetical protein